MKTQSTFTREKTLKSLGFFAVLIIACLAFSPVQAQTKKAASTEVAQNERMIKGIISDLNGPLESASIVLKGGKAGTTTNSKGEFTFPTPLNTGDVLVISYLGYETREARIKDDTTFLRLEMSEELLEFVGALNADKPYKSKRSN